MKLLRNEKDKVGFFGHTHEIGIFTEDPGRLEWLSETKVRIPDGLPCAVTVGAVGQPRHETDRHASWVLWEPAERVLDLRRTYYDRFQAVRDIIEAGLPLESGLRLLTSEELKHLTALRDT